MDNKIEAELYEFLGPAKRIAILGIGNDLRTDDGVGPYIIANIHLDNPRVMVENVGSVPEAFARPLAEFGAERVVLVDAADMRREPGHVQIVTKDRIGGIAISTHSMPLSFLMGYLEQETGGRTILLGIQPQSIAFGEGLTPRVKDAATRIIRVIERVVNRVTGDTDGDQNY